MAAGKSNQAKITAGVAYYALEGPEKDLAEAVRLFDELRDSYDPDHGIRTTDVLKVADISVKVRAASEAISHVRGKMFEMTGWS